MSEYKNSIWVAIAALLIIAIITVGLSAVLVLFFEEIRNVIPAIPIVVCLVGMDFNFLFARKHPSKQRMRELIVVAVNYLVIILSSLIYPLGFFWLYALPFVLIVLIFVNNEVATDAASLCLLQMNTLFSVPLAATVNGLCYAANICADWLTLYITIIMGVVCAAMGFVFATIALLIYNQEYKI